MCTSDNLKAEKPMPGFLITQVIPIIQMYRGFSNNDGVTINILLLILTCVLLEMFTKPIIHTIIIGNCCVVRKHFSLQCSLVVVVAVAVVENFAV